MCEQEQSQEPGTSPGTPPPLSWVKPTGIERPEPPWKRNSLATCHIITLYHWHFWETFGKWYFYRAVTFRIATVWRHSAILKVPEGITVNFIFGSSCLEAKSFWGAKVLVERANGPCYLHCTVTRPEKGNPILHVQLSPRCCLLDTESQSRKKPAGSGLVPWYPQEHANLPGFSGCRLGGGGGELCFHPWSVLATHTPQSRDIRPLSWEAVDASPGSAFSVFPREGLWREKVPLARPQHLPGLLCPNVLGHTQYSVGDPHQFSPGIAGVMSLTLQEAPDKHTGICSRAEWLWLLAGAALRQTNRCCRWVRWGTFNVGSAAGRRGLLPFHQARKRPSVQPPERPGCGRKGGGLVPHLWPIGIPWFPSQ